MSEAFSRVPRDMTMALNRVSNDQLMSLQLFHAILVNRGNNVLSRGCNLDGFRYSIFYRIFEIKKVEIYPPHLALGQIPPPLLPSPPPPTKKKK